MYLHTLVDPSFTDFLGEFPGFGLALVPNFVVPEAEHGVRMKQKSRLKVLLWLGFQLGPCSLMAANITTRLPRKEM